MNAIYLASKAVQTRLTGKPQILDVAISITMACNANCAFCHTDRRDKQLLKTHEIFKIFDEFAKNGVKVVCLSGGEPLLRKDVGEIIAYIKHLGMTPSVISNGFQYKEEILQAGVANVNLSLDYPDERHDKSRVVEGGWEKYKESVKFYTSLKEKYGHKTYVNMTVMKENLDVLEEMVEFALAYNCDGVGLSPYVVQEEDGEQKKEKIDFETPIFNLKKKYGRFITSSKMLIDNIPNYMHHPQEPKKLKIFCYSGLLTCYVDALGNISPCMIYNDYSSKVAQQFNLLKKPMKEILESEAYAKELKMIANKECSGCLCANSFEPNVLYHPGSYGDMLHLLKKKSV